eukprot:gene11268-13781_t
MKHAVKTGALAALAISLLSQVAAAETTVTLMAYSGLFQERYTKAVVEPFMKAHPDIKITYFPVNSSAAMLGNARAQKAAPQADVVIMDVSVSKAGTDEGLVRYDPASDGFVRYLPDSGPKNYRIVRRIISDGAGGMWLATWGGLQHFNPKTGRFLVHQHDPARPD